MGPMGLMHNFMGNSPTGSGTGRPDVLIIQGDVAKPTYYKKMPNCNVRNNAHAKKMWGGLRRAAADPKMYISIYKKLHIYIYIYINIFDVTIFYQLRHVYRVIPLPFHYVAPQND